MMGPQRVEKASGTVNSEAPLQHLVDQSVVLGFRTRHEEVPFRVVTNLFEGLAGALRKDLVQAFAQLQDFPRLDLDVRRLPLSPARRLVDHDARVRQREALALRAGGQQEG